MGSSLLRLFALVLVRGVLAIEPYSPSFDQNYYIRWSKDHVHSLHQGREVQLFMDKSSGSGIGSKLTYGSGFFHLRIKLPDRDSAGVVTAFYLASHSNAHDEIDFEFLGNKEGKPYSLQTNVYANGKGNREQRIRLWFDPTSSFHTYRILWNPYQIVFFVDNIPIRVFKNNIKIGVDYPSQPMQLLASIWNGDSWATDGGRTKINWTQAPFKAYFRSFNIDGCPSYNFNTQTCHNSKFWWNREEFWTLSPGQQRAYQAVRKMYMTYDYCTDKSRYPTPPPECRQ